MTRRERRGESRCSARPVCWWGVRWRRAEHCVTSAPSLEEPHRSVVSVSAGSSPDTRLLDVLRNFGHSNGVGAGGLRVHRHPVPLPAKEGKGKRRKAGPSGGSSSSWEEKKKEMKCDRKKKKDKKEETNATLQAVARTGCKGGVGKGKGRLVEREDVSCTRHPLPLHWPLIPRLRSAVSLAPRCSWSGKGHTGSRQDWTSWAGSRHAAAR